MRFEGVFVANITPFNSEGAISLPALKRFLEWQASQGITGFVPCGTTGEAATLSRREWSEVVGLTCEIAKARGLKVIAGCGGNNTATVLELMLEAKGLGCDAALVVTPYYNKPTQAGLLAHYRHVADKSQLPTILYNIPGRAAVSLSTDTIAALLKHETIVGIKEATGSYSTWLSLSQAADWTTKAWLAGDDDAHAITEMLGGCGIISASANVMPRLFVEIHRLAIQGDWAGAFALQKKGNDLIRALFHETSPAPIKFALSQMGHCENTLRLPLVPVLESTQKVVSVALEGLELLA